MTTDVLAPVRHLIGTAYSDSVKATILEATGLAVAVGPTDIATMEIRNDRVQIKVDGNGIIEDLIIS
ncbi:I78 family peptidase inhibitor [Pseudomonas entomophila]|uniref:I78 family peptidase inhibitor n=1 Tax=Pseudomonas entomophila TaxID=312306 RepID=UPI0023D83942|nr:I78 family peptidase inhibitor [Pseudomonas entomophila]MDF0733336.1 I78 family peptidase inhibitor [Pseudomonas entomophila]